MLETLMGTLLGSGSRLVPEVLKYLDKKNERQYELTVLDKKYLLAQREGNTSIELKATDALIAATTAQSNQVGVRWVDGLNALIRPLLALQWLIILWPTIILAGFILSIGSGTEPLIALKETFGVEEKALASSIAAFWLVDRSLRKIGV